MVRSDQGAEGVRHHQADEADRTGQRDGAADQERGGGERQAGRARRVDADRGGRVAPGAERVEIAPEIEEEGEADRDGGRGADQRREHEAVEPAHQPPDHALGLAEAGQVLDQHGGGRAEHRDGDAGQEQGGGRQLLADPGEPVDDEDRGAGAGERGDADPALAEEGAIEPELDRDEGGERGAGRDAERVRLGERVSQHGLERAAGPGQAGADQRAAEHPRQPVVEEAGVAELGQSVEANAAAVRDVDVEEEGGERGEREDGGAGGDCAGEARTGQAGEAAHFFPLTAALLGRRRGHRRAARRRGAARRRPRWRRVTSGRRPAGRRPPRGRGAGGRAGRRRAPRG